MRFQWLLYLTGLTGEVKLDEAADRIGNYRVWHLRANDDQYEPLLDVNMGHKVLSV